MTSTRRRFLGSTAAVLGAGALGGTPLPLFAQAEVRPAPGLPAPRFVKTNGIRMGYYEKGSGLPVVFCHGFPELAYSWRHQIRAFSAAGYRAIAPDQRGYGLTDRPQEVSEYSLKKLCDDMAGLLDALELQRAVFCGHDWGGGVVWMMPRFHPDRVAGVIGVNTPTSHPQHPGKPNPLIVRSDRYYTVTFQPPGVADAALAKDVRKTFEMILRRGGFWDAEEFAKLPEDSLERRVDLLGMLEAGDFSGELILTEDELAYFVATFEATGFTGGLNWYRAAGRGLGIDDPSGLAWDIDKPCLYVGAENDVILPPSSGDHIGGFVSDFERYTVEDCGHWTQQEKPEEFNRVAIAWLQTKFGNRKA
ncbi:MAG: alpha/beta hydrolase [Thermoanaerobaculia bacterium]|nr:alpha/beta hydrolase [Thermoanaerobaculia bacterium]